MSSGQWVETLSWIASGAHRPLPLIVLAQNNGEPMDEMNLAGRAVLLNQQMRGEVVEVAVLIKQLFDLQEKGVVERAEDGFHWHLTTLGELLSRQWVPANTEPSEPGPLGPEAIRGWRDRVVSQMDTDVKLAEEAGIDQQEWFMSQSQQMIEMHVLNRVLGEEKLPDWLVSKQFAASDPADTVGNSEPRDS